MLIHLKIHMYILLAAILICYIVPSHYITKWLDRLDEVTRTLAGYL